MAAHTIRKVFGGPLDGAKIEGDDTDVAIPTGPKSVISGKPRIAWYKLAADGNYYYERMMLDDEITI